jgi:hypothetical protein
MLPAPKISPQFVTDPEGRKKAVIIPIKEYEELLEDLNDLALLAERREEPTIPHNVVMEDLKRHGYLSD